ncbi:MAG: hypothetical protein IJ802_01330 [Kiritimatiellae bacterium]|nr:hypothetical protein [Kiritimatiellia bacterium]
MKLVTIFFCTACAIAAALLQSSRKTERVADATPANLTEMAFAMLGGFRGVLSEVVWFQADRLEAAGEYTRLAQTAAYLTRLEPHTPEVWCYSAWNLAFNISASMPTAEERWRWVCAGLDLLRKDALELNPASPAICKEIAWIYLLKLCSNLDDAADFYRTAYRDAMLGAGADNCGFAGRGVLETERLFGPQDYSQPEAAALYYIALGLDKADRRTREDLLREAFQALLFATIRDRTRLPQLEKTLATLQREFPESDFRELDNAVRHRFQH